jgi:PAS domain S-box-containing protein
VLAAWFGVGPALAAGALSILAFAYFLLPTIFSTALTAGDIRDVALFAIAALFVIGLGASRRETTGLFRRLRPDLEAKVRDLDDSRRGPQIKSVERAPSEQNPRELERELQLTIDTIPVLIATHRPDGTRQFGNKPLRDYLGPDVDIEDSAAIIHPDDLVLVNEAWRSHIISGEPSVTEHRLRRADGEYRWHLVRRVPLRDETGEIIKWYAVGSDIEDQKRAEAALRRSEAQLAKAKRELQATIDSIPTMAASYEPDGARDFVNKPWQDFTGMSQEEVKGKSWSITVHPDDHAAGEREWRDCMATGRPFQMEQRFRRHDGEYRWHMTRRVPLRDEEGKIVKWYGVGFDIEEQKRAESALRQSEAYLAEAQRLSLTGSFGWDVSSGKIVWSEQTFGILGYDPATKPSLGLVLQRVHPDDVALVRKVIDRATGDRQGFDFEHRLLMPDGSIKDLHVVAHAATGDPASPQFIGAVMDITARKQAYAALERSEQRYRNLFEYMPVALMQFDARERADLFADLRAQGVTDLGAYMDANPDVERRVLEGISVELANERMMELLGARNMSDLAGPTTRFWGASPDTFRRSLESRFRGEPAFQEETKITTLDGRVVDVLCTISRPQVGKTVLGFVDITDRVRAQEALRASEQRYRHLFQHMPIALVQLKADRLVELFKNMRTQGMTELAPYLDRHPEFLERIIDEFTIEEVNEQTIRMFGGRDASDFAGSIARFWRESPGTFRRAMESRFREEPIFQEETKVVALDGRVVDVLFTAARPKDLHMTLIGIIETTELVRAREMLQRVQADFAHAARVSMLGELTASIAHEVNQPLAAIATNGEAGLRWLDRPEPDIAEARELTKRMVADARRAADVIARIRAMATRQVPQQTLLSVDEVIREALLFLRAEIQSHSVLVTHRPAPAAPKVLADRTQLQQVIVNLAVNAIQSMAQAGTPRPTLVVRTSFLDPHTLSCTLEDSGPGIMPEHLDHLFDSFFTTKDAGMGLGLPICRSIIETHGGRIRADNGSPHGGARFTFTLPTAAAAAAAS